MLRAMTAFVLRGLASVLTVVWLAGCDGDGGGNGGGGNDFGANDPNLYAAIGDSITESGYPAVLSAMLGAPVMNLGEGGTCAADGVARTPSVLNAYKPGHLLVLYGANDVTHGHDNDTTISQLRSILHMAINNGTEPVIATLTPMMYEHQVFHAGAVDLSERIRTLADEEGVSLADLEEAFGDSEAYMEADGLHPNAAGIHLIAQTFYSVLH